MNDTTNNTFYLAFKDVHPSWSLIGCALIYGIIAIFGIIFNFSVIVVTYLTKSFRGTVNYLLALYSLFELVHQLGHFLLVYNAFSGQNFIEYRLAAMILFIPLIGLGGIVPAMFFTGIDRLIGIAFSEFHDKLKKRLYLALLTVVSVSYGFCFSASEYQNAINDGDQQMTTGSFLDFTKRQTDPFYILRALSIGRHSKRRFHLCSNELQIQIKLFHCRMCLLQ
ncbi:hypothetical protein niasHT_015173 [Heterodera trifolii]|uniref:Uncharacterized protein n=1 Tax=Heterodera trifolii TaxID=157864 RepID=A0ABD2L9S2_9BILA